ncbi:hypothetical protein FPV67DRAFT_1101285 [Lyophyllum atratum]|nr:hypothetical protein FPV67DRAFT_1101285 [Lyophyllum atratum]
MPLFSHKNKHATDAPMTGTGAAPMTGAGSGLNSRPQESTNMNNTNVMPGTGTHGHNNYGGVPVGGRHHMPGQQPGFDNNPATEGYNTTGANVGTQQQHHMPGTAVGGNGMGAAGHGALPPANTLNHSGQSRGGGGQAFTGKVERTVGTLTGSSSLKAKGQQKEQEANSFKVQGAELAEAERLEREALMRRERAVGHGAHPDNKHLGAGSNSAQGGGVGGMSGGY